jgi:hypothetical protein
MVTVLQEHCSVLQWYLTDADPDISQPVEHCMFLPACLPACHPVVYSPLADKPPLSQQEEQIRL